MRFYLKEFIKENFEGKSMPYLFILWSVYKNLKTYNNRLSNSIKEELEKLDLNSIDFEQKVNKAEKVIKKIKSTDSRQQKLDYYSTITSIQIQNFRGFGSLENDDKGNFIKLNNRKNIFFGPNGGGKTSFCEAFEFKLTGNIKEAKRRNIPLNTYIKRDDKNHKIQITFNNNDMNADKLNDYNKAYFQNSFIEKNRLQEFALLGSKDTGTKEKDVIASLLGMHELDELISTFVKPTSFNLLDLKRQKIFNSIRELQNENDTNIRLKRTLDEDKEKLEMELKENYNIELNLSELDNIIKEKNKLRGSLNLKINLSKEKSPKHHTLQEFEREIMFIEREINGYTLAKKNLQEQALELNFENLYKSLNDISNENIEACPACETPLIDVKINPFQKAKDELLKLKDISLLKKDLEERKKKINNECYSIISTFINNYVNNKGVSENISQEGINKLIDSLKTQDNYENRLELVIIFVKNLKMLQADIQVYFNNLKGEIDKDIEKDKLMNNIQKEIEQIDEQILYLNTVKKQLDNFESKITALNKKLESYNEEIEKLEQLKSDEEKYNDFLEKVQEQYKTFYKDLENFKIAQETSKINNIENKALHYYQQINKDDSESEFIKKIHFALEGSNYKIFVIKKSGEQEIDAYACLSEGHLRSLGLSLMLAVAEKNNSPFLLFDDVVNAIDSDHRANIIDMFYNDPYLQKTQLIITTHDRLFWERFCNYYEIKINKKEVTDISYILNYTNKGSVFIQHNVSFKSKIEEALDKYDIRQALIYCRVWFESEVLKYCIENGIELKGKFTRDNKSNLLKASLESIYNILNTRFNENENLKIIKKDLINWQAQNQEHHSFDENSYNFVHSKNSDEVSKIFIALERFINDLYPEQSLFRVENAIKELNIHISNAEKKLENPGFCSKAPTEVISGVREKYLRDIENKELYEAEKRRLEGQQLVVN